MGRAVAGWLLGALVALSVAAPAAGLQPGPGPRMSLVSQTPWVTAGGTFELGVGVTGVADPDDVELVVTVHEAVTSRSQFGETLEGRLLGRQLFQDTVPLSEAEVDGGGTVRLAVALRGPGRPDDPDLLDLAGPGVHPVRVELVDASAGAPLAGFVTHLVRTRDDDAPPMAVAWLQPVAAPPALRPDGTVALDGAALASLAATVSVLASSETPLVVVPVPETLDALRTENPAILADLDRSLARRQVVARPYVDLDVAQMASAGLHHELAASRDRGASVVAATLGVPGEVGTWVADGLLGPRGLAALTGIERLVVPEEALVPLDRPLTLANPFLVEAADGRRVEAAAVDAGLAGHFTAGGDPVLAAHHLLADLAVLAYDAPGLTRGVVVRPPPGWEPDAELLAPALAGLAAGSVVRPVTLDQLFDTVPPAQAADGDLVRTLTTAGGAPPLPVADLRHVRDDIVSFSAMTDPAGAALDLLERLVLVAAAESLTGAERRAYLDGARAVVGHRLGQIGISSEGSFRLTSREASIPLTLVNGLEAEARVSLLLESDKLDFLTGGEGREGRAVLPLTLQPGNNPMMVPVEARTSGAFPLLITVRSPDGRLEVASTQLTVRSTFLSGVGIVLSAGAGLFLCGWWARHWRTARRDRRLVPPPETAPQR